MAVRHNNHWWQCDKGKPSDFPISKNSSMADATSCRQFAKMLSWSNHEHKSENEFLSATSVRRWFYNWILRTQWVRNQRWPVILLDNATSQEIWKAHMLIFVSWDNFGKANRAVMRFKVFVQFQINVTRFQEIREHRTRESRCFLEELERKLKLKFEKKQGLNFGFFKQKIDRDLERSE